MGQLEATTRRLFLMVPVPFERLLEDRQEGARRTPCPASWASAGRFRLEDGVAGQWETLPVPQVVQHGRLGTASFLAAVTLAANPTDPGTGPQNAHCLCFPVG